MGKGGLEPPRIAAPDPKSGPSASSGTPPGYETIPALSRVPKWRQAAATSPYYSILPGLSQVVCEDVPAGILRGHLSGLIGKGGILKKIIDNILQSLGIFATIVIHRISK